MSVTIHSQNGKPKRQRRPWTPGDKDHLIYQWVKFDGQTQARTAADFGISQATVSRIIDRYERWQAHAAEREGGRLDSAERRRAQRWLTYERNERILASALRIADRMEGVTELHKSVRTKPQSEWYKEGTEIRSEERGVDRHGVAARFLRLAFRINMEQLKLVEQDPPARPDPLTESELAAEEARDAAVAEELAAAKRRAEEHVAEVMRGHELPFAEPQPDPGQTPESAASEAPAMDAVLSTEYSVFDRPHADENGNRVNLHNVHSEEASQIAATCDTACACAADQAIQETVNDACIPVAGVGYDNHESAAPTHFSGWAACPAGGG